MPALQSQIMTDRLYYHDSFLYEFDAEVLDRFCVEL